MIIKITPKTKMTYHKSDKIIPVRYLKMPTSHCHIATENIADATEIDEASVVSEISSLEKKWGHVADFEVVK